MGMIHLLPCAGKRQKKAPEEFNLSQVHRIQQSDPVILQQPQWIEPPQGVIVNSRGTIISSEANISNHEAMNKLQKAPTAAMMNAMTPGGMAEQQLRKKNTTDKQPLRCQTQISDEHPRAQELLQVVQMAGRPTLLF